MLTNEVVPAMMRVLDMLAKGCNHHTLVDPVVDSVLKTQGLQDIAVAVPGYALHSIQCARRPRSTASTPYLATATARRAGGARTVGGSYSDRQT